MRLAAAMSGVAALGAMGACSAKHDPAPGEILLAIDTNLKVPDDIDAIGISVIDTVTGTSQEDDTFTLGTGDDARFPATLALVRGTGNPLTMRAVGYKNGQAFTVREATTIIPADRTAVLHLDLSWLNDGTVSGAQTATVQSLTVACPAGQSPIGGTCQSFTLDSASLATYTASSLGTSTDAGAVDVDSCFAADVTTVVTPSASCTLLPPATPVNYAIQLAASNGSGWCSGAACIIPLVNLAGDGWDLEADGFIHLPSKLCADGDVVVATPVTSACPALSLANPAQQSYGAATDADATVPLADGGTDAATDAGADSGETGPPVPVFLPYPGVDSIAVDPTRLYVLSDGGAKLQMFAPPTFASTDTGTASPYTYISTTGYPESAAAYPYFAVVNGEGLVDLINVNSSAETGPTDRAVLDPALTDLGAGTVQLAYAVASVAGAAYTENQTGGTVNLDDDNASPLDTTAQHVAVDPTSPTSAPSYATSGMNAAASAYYVEYGSTRFDASAAALATQFAFPFSGTNIAWSDSTGVIDYWNGMTVQAVEKASTVTTALRGLAATSGRLFWIGASDNALYTATLTLAGAVGPAARVAPLADGGTQPPVRQVIVLGTEVLWFDDLGIYRLDAAAFP